MKKPKLTNLQVPNFLSVIRKYVLSDSLIVCVINFYFIFK